MSQYPNIQVWGFRLLKIAWMAAEVALVGWAVWLQYQGRTEEQILVFYALNVLSFPAGLLFYMVFSGCMLLFDSSSAGPAADYAFTILVWIGFFVAGYLQWFRLVPYLIRKTGAQTSGEG